MTSPAAPIDFLAELDAEVPGWANAEWDRAISLLKAFISVHGHARVAQSHVDEGFPLGNWVSRQRKARKDSKLSDSRIAELDALGFIWGASHKDGWQRGIDALHDYVAVNGHAHVPQSHVEDGFNLGHWVSTQRQARKDSKLSDGRIAELDALGFVWDASEIYWRSGIDALRSYIAATGHALVPRDHVEDDFPLGTWVNTKRQARKDSKLSDDRIAELDALGFVWDAIAISWQRGISALRAYIAANGHARVPQRHVEDGFNLGGWVDKQRRSRKNSKLSDDRIAELDALGFVWIASARTR